MSLKTLHIVFISASSALAFFCGVWAVMRGIATSAWLMVGFGLVSFLAGAALILYGSAFLKKIRQIA